MSKPLGQWRDDALREMRRLQFALRLLLRLLPLRRHAPLWWAALAGVFGAAAALLFQTGTHGLQWLLTGGHIGGQVEVFRELQAWQRVLVPCAGALGAGLVLTLAARFVRQNALDYMEAVALGDGIVPARSSLIRSTAALLSIASGAAIGREGPLVQLSAVAASLVGRLTRMTPARMRLLVACGAAAGIAAAYNAPIAGALFVAEIIVGSIAMESLGPLIIASVVGALVMRLTTGDEPLYAFAGFHLAAWWELFLYALLGVVCAFAAHLFLRGLRAGRWLFARVSAPLWVRLGLGGLAVGLIAWRYPEVTGNGQSAIRTLLATDSTAASVALLLGLKVLAVALVFGSGAVGGVFTPALFTGAAVGLLAGLGAQALLPQAGIEPHGYAVVGMGALLAAATQAPVTAILLIFEMSLQYQLMPPLMLAAVAAHVTARTLGTSTLYGAALAAGPRSVFDKPLGAVTAGDMMRARPVTLEAGAKFRDVARQFLRAPARELFVTDTAGNYAGVVLLSDVQPFLRDADLAEIVTARDIVRDDVPVIARTLGLPEAMAIFSRCEHESLPVVAGPERRLVGTLPRSDVFLAISELARRESVRSGDGN